MRSNSPLTSSSVCSICKSNQKTITDTDSGELICSNCGVVISDKTEQIGIVVELCIIIRWLK